MKLSLRRLAFACLFAAVLPCPATALAVDVQGDFLTHVVTVTIINPGQPGNGTKSTQAINSPSGKASFTINYTPTGANSVSLKTVEVQADATLTTPIARLTSPGSFAAGSRADFAVYKGSVPIRAGLDANFTSGTLTGNPRVVSASGNVGTGSGTMVGKAAGAGVAMTMQSSPVASNGSAATGAAGDGSVAVADSASGEDDGFLSTTRLVAYTVFQTGPRFAASSENVWIWYARVEIETYYNFRVPDGAAQILPKVIHVAGDAEVTLPTATAPSFVTVGMELDPNSRIVTGVESRVDVVFPDGMLVHIQELTDVVLREYTHPLDYIRTRLWLKAGEVSSELLHRTQTRSDFGVRTPIAGGAPRGTIFTVTHRETPSPKSYFVVDDGEVDVDPDGAGLASFTLLARQLGSVTPTATFTENVPQPEIVRSGSGAVISWKNSVTPVTLESSASLDPGSWQAANLAIQSQNGSSQAVVPPLTGRGFYRLRLDLSQ